MEKGMEVAMKITKENESMVQETVPEMAQRTWLPLVQRKISSYLLES